MSSLWSGIDFQFGNDVPFGTDISLRKGIASKYDMPLQQLNLSSRTLKALLRYNIKITISDVILADASFTAIEGLGTAGLNELDTKVSQLLTANHNQTNTLSYSSSDQLAILPTSQIFTIASSKVFPESIQKLSIDQLQLEEKVCNALISANITTIGEMDNVSGSLIVEATRMLSVEALESINSALVALHNSVTEENKVDWFLFWKNQEIQMILPTFSSITSIEEVMAELPLIIEEVIHRECDERAGTIIKSRLGFGSEVKSTLEDIGNAFGGISRERVRQIEEKALRSLRATFVEQQYKGKNYHVHPHVHTIIQKICNCIESSTNKLVSEIKLMSTLNQDLNLDTNKFKRELVFILSLIGVQCIEFNYPDAASVWGYIEPIQYRRLENWLKRLDDLLTQETALPLSEFKILAYINKKVKKTEVLLPQQLKEIIELCNTVERCEDGSVWGKFEYLKGRGNQVERIMTLINRPMSMADITREINYRLFPLGKRLLAEENLTNQIISDAHNRFVPIGRSGQWGLKVWEHIDTKSILDLMEQYLIISNKPATANEIYSYVSERRPVSRHSIPVYLATDKKRFIRVSLTTWGLAKWPNTESADEWNSEKVADFVAAIFKQNKAKELDYKIIKNALMKEVELNEHQVQGILIHNPVIKTRSGTKWGERIAVFQPNYKKILAQPKKNKSRRRGELHQQIETSVLNILNAVPNKEMLMTDLIQILYKEFGSSETSLYQHLAQIDFLDRISVPNSLKKICRVKEIMNENSNAGTLGERVSKSVLAILEHMPNKEIRLDDLIKQLLKDYDCPKATLYRYIASLDYVERLEIPNLRTKLCRLKGTNVSGVIMDTISKSQENFDEIIQQLRELQTGDGKAYEEIVKSILEICFREEFDFTPFEVQNQLVSYNGKRIRDFVIDNRNPKMEFWRDLKHVRKVEKILFDAKNYKSPIVYSEIADTLRYIHRNKAFGKFIVIISRRGVKDLDEFLEAYSDSDEIVLFLNDEDLITMLNLKREGKSPTNLIDQKYHEFLGKK